jgi:hypothetical protein
MRRKNITFIILAVSIVEILELIFIFGWARTRIESALIKRYEEERRHALEMTMDAIRRDIDSTVTKLQVASTIEAVANSSGTLCEDKLKEVYPYFNDRVDEINRANTEATVLCSSNSDTMGVNLDKNQPHIAKILTNSDHPTVMGRVRESPVDERPVMGIHVPVYKNGNFDGTLSAPIYLDRIREVYLKSIIDYPSTRIYLKDDNGDYLYGSKGEDRGASSETSYLVKKEVFPGRFWTLSAYTSKSEVVGQIDRSADITREMNFSTRIFIFLLMTLVTGTVVVVIASRKI